MPASQTILYLVYALAAATGILLVEMLYLQLLARGRHKDINRRIHALSNDARPQEALRALLRERGLTDSGDYIFGLLWLNRLYAQSGVTGNPAVFFSIFGATGALAVLVVKFLG